ncbi:MAG: KEOPS complex kinase/ATPase Bud32 [Candidatus Nanohaloarchaea archaeon]
MEFQGAEATVRIEEDRVVKERKEKQYRHTEIDRELRTERTDQELRLMEEADRYGCSVPEVTKTAGNVLEMERVDGKPLKEVIGKKTGLMESYGENVARLHSAKIIHGDLTTSNAMASDGLVVIDFGLSFRSERTEDRAVDIHLLRQVLRSSHPGIAEEAWEKFRQGYSEFEESEEVLEQLEEVESRGRYK